MLYASQQQILRVNTFKRLHGNEWVINESAFITPDVWDACVQPDLHPLLPEAAWT